MHADGYRACLVGGAVRDLLLGVMPKDFDVATDAEPEEVVAVFGRKARLIGRRFRIAHVRFGRDVIEVSTFRADPATNRDDDRELDDAGRVLRDNVFGSIAEDARRRDFAINGLYYDIADDCVHDYVGGMVDVERRRLHLIGNAATRYREDPVRMIRAVRIAAKLGLNVDDAAMPPRELTPLLADVPPARLFDEVLKLFMHSAGPRVYRMLREQDLLAPLFDQTIAVLDSPAGAASEALIEKAIANTAARIEHGKPVTPAFIFAALLWPAIREAAAVLEQDGMPGAPALASAQAEVVSRQVQRVAIPKRFSIPMREIWQLQPRFHKRRGKQPARLIAHPRFRAAYDFLLLRAEVGEVDTELARWWTEIQDDETMPAPASTPRHSLSRSCGSTVMTECADTDAVNVAWIGLGSNLVSPADQILGALDELTADDRLTVLAVSRLYRTTPVGGPAGQPDFCNACAAVATPLSALALLDLTQAIEAGHGRVRDVRWGPRTLDLDLLAFNETGFDHPRLILPHPRAHERAFVLVPLAEIAPALVLGRAGRVADRAAAVDCSGIEHWGRA